MGPYLVHMNHLKLVHDVFPLDEHGLGLSDIERRDRQNWASMQKLSFPKVRNCLERLKNGDGGNQRPNPTLLGTKTYLLIVWYYVEIFCSSVASLKTRVKYAAIVTHFLGIWFNYVQRQPQLSLRKNFITRETYVDVLISCHFAVLLISYMRANFGQQECHLDLTGSDVLKDFWSKNGQWVGNHHNYNFSDLRRNSSHMIRLEQIRVDPLAPEFAKPHPKQESIWDRQYTDGFMKAPLDDYPTPESVVDAWRDGRSAAQDLVRSVDMAPNDTCEHEGGDDGRNDDDDDHDGSGGCTGLNR